MTNRPLKPGDRVAIVRNPHHPHAEQIVGKVIALRPAEGFMGCDLVDVEYCDPRSDEVLVRPFVEEALGGRDQMLEAAARHEARAAELRAIAEELQ